MARTKEQTKALDDVILTALAELGGWQTADAVAARAKSRADKRGLFRMVDGYSVGARLRSLKSRGKVRNRTHEGGYMAEWRRA